MGLSSLRSTPASVRRQAGRSSSEPKSRQARRRQSVLDNRARQFQTCAGEAVDAHSLPIAEAVVTLDDLSQTGQALVATAAILCDEIGQSFGVAEMGQLTRAGELLRALLEHRYRTADGRVGEHERHPYQELKGAAEVQPTAHRRRDHCFASRARGPTLGLMALAAIVLSAIAIVVAALYGRRQSDAAGKSAAAAEISAESAKVAAEAAKLSASAGERSAAVAERAERRQLDREDDSQWKVDLHAGRIDFLLRNLGPGDAFEVRLEVLDPTRAGFRGGHSWDVVQRGAAKAFTFTVTGGGQSPLRIRWKTPAGHERVLDTAIPS